MVSPVTSRPTRSETQEEFFSASQETPNKKEFLLKMELVSPIKFCFIRRTEERGKEYNLREEEDENCFSFAFDFIEAETAYTVRAKAELQEKENVWSEEIEFTTPEFSELCAWKKMS